MPIDYSNPQGLDPNERRQYVAVLLPSETFNELFPPDTTFKTFGLNAGEAPALWADVTCSQCDETTSDVWLKPGENPHQGLCEQCHSSDDNENGKDNTDEE